MPRRQPLTGVRVLLALTLVLGAFALAACTSGQQPVPALKPPTTQTTAKAFLPAAISTLSTAAPDAKLLVCQSFEPVTATSTPGWEYLFGSPKSGKVYAVLVMGGRTQFMEYGTAGLTPAQWAEVPSTDQWVVDSDVAHEKALSVYPNGKDATYYPGFVTYVPKDKRGGDNLPMTWYIRFDRASQGSTATDTVLVDMKTGDTRLATAK